MSRTTLWRRMLRWFRIVVGAVLVAVAGALAIAYLRYSAWRNDRLDELAAGSEVVQTGAGPVEYAIKGRRGPIMLFLHGAPGGYDASPDAGSGFRVLAPSRPGYLATPLETGRTPREQARAYAALLDALGLREPVLVMAASGGGPSGIAFSAMYPERTLGLIALEAVSESTADEGGIPFFLRSDFAMWAVFGAVEALQGAAGIAAMVIPDARERQLVLDDPEKTERLTRLVWSAWPISRRAAGWRNDIRQFERLALPAEEITVATLIVHGTEDANVPFAESEHLATSIRGARLYAIEGADHMMPLTREVEVDAAIDAFLHEHGLTEFVD